MRQITVENANTTASPLWKGAEISWGKKDLLVNLSAAAVGREFKTVGPSNAPSGL